MSNTTGFHQNARTTFTSSLHWLFWSWIKKSSFWKSGIWKLEFSCLPNATFLPELRTARNWTLVYTALQHNFQPPWPISQTLGWKNAIFTSTWNSFVLQNGKFAFPNGQNSISRCPNSKVLIYWIFILFQYTNACLCTKFWEIHICKISHHILPESEKLNCSGSFKTKQVF